MVQGFDGVVISPINPDAMSGVFEQVAAKMPLVTTDSDAPKSPRKVYVGTNNVEAGRMAGNTAIAALKAANITKGKAALFVGRIDMQNAIERKQGIDETLGKVPGIEILPIFLDHADRALAKKNVEDALARYPDLVLAMGIWSYNGPCMAGAVRASSFRSRCTTTARCSPGRRSRRSGSSGSGRTCSRKSRSSRCPSARRRSCRSSSCPPGSRCWSRRPRRSSSFRSGRRRCLSKSRRRRSSPHNRRCRCR
jgi:hypothetical protein